MRHTAATPTPAPAGPAFAAFVLAAVAALALALGLGLAVALTAAPVAGASESTAAQGSAVPSTPSEASPPAPGGSTPPSSPSPTASGETTSPASAGETTTTTSEAPEAPEAQTPRVQAQRQQAPSSSARHHANANGHGHAGSGAGGAQGPGAGTPHGSGKPTKGNAQAPAPSALTPPPPSALGAGLGGVPSLFIEDFPLPPFLLPIYQAAGRAYGIPWQVLAAINEVETDFGRDLSVSSAGAEGWMQFLPSSWAQYGVDANGDGYADPYNPADAIFAAARYLAAAGGARHIREAIFAYNHSQSYVASVRLRAQLLSATPPQLLAALAGLAEARFPVHAPAQFTDGFPTAPGTLGHPGHPLVATAIQSSPGAPVIAVQDGTITAIGHSPTLGRYVSLRDAYGDTYTYGQLGSVATLYPVLAPRVSARRRARLAAAAAVAVVGKTGGAHGGSAGALAPASAGVQPRSPISAGAISSGLALGAAATLEGSASAPVVPTPLLPAHRARHARTMHQFRAGREEVTLHPLRLGSRVIAGTVLGHLGSPTLVFQIRPAGVGAPLIDPKPILDGWVRLEGSLLYRLTGTHRFPSAPAQGARKLAPRIAARLAGNFATATLTPGQWLALVAHLGTIPDPVIAPGHSTAAIALAPTSSHPSSTSAAAGGANGHH